MAKYSKEEIAGFEEKDKRISKLAIIKSLIEKAPLEDVYEVNKICGIADKYVSYVYNINENPTAIGCVANGRKVTHNWAEIAEGLNLAIPNEENIKILNLLVDEYEKANKASANPSLILSHIMSSFGRYPTNEGSVGIILNSLQ